MKKMLCMQAYKIKIYIFYGIVKSSQSEWITITTKLDGAVLVVPVFIVVPHAAMQKKHARKFLVHSKIPAKVAL